MLTRSLTAGGVAILIAAGLSTESRAYGQTSESNPMVHLEGCVFAKAELTDTAPAAATAASTQTYVLTNVAVIAGPISDDVAAKTTYSLDNVDQDRLRSLRGKPAAVTGRVGSGSQPKLEVVSIREVIRPCPARPSNS